MNRKGSAADQLTHFIREHAPLVVLTGAGISVDSGIPAYRDTKGNWRSATPIQAREFESQTAAQRRYWARSYYGWPVLRDAEPNTAHRALAALEQQGLIELLVTQNVDGLHQKAGSRRVVDLHGRVDRVLCLNCAAEYPREAVQRQLIANNDWPEQPRQLRRPDGDMDIDTALIEHCRLPACERCAGTLKPDVVFFGGSIPSQRVDQCRQALTAGRALLVVGSSLQVFSGYRLCRQADREGKPIALINPGVSRADNMARLRLRSAAGPLLQAVSAALD